MLISDILPAVEKGFRNTLRGPQPKEYIPKNFRTPAGGIVMIYTIGFIIMLYRGFELTWNKERGKGNY